MAVNFQGWQVKFSAGKVMRARGCNLNFSHMLQIFKLIVITEGRDFGNVLHSSAKAAAQCATKGKC